MPARCPTCGEEALTETARFCIGCGGAIPEQEPHVVMTELAAAEPFAPPPPALESVPEPDPVLESPPPAVTPPAVAPKPAPTPAPPKPAAPTPPSVRDDAPRFEPRPSPSRAAEPVYSQATRARPPRLAPMPTMRDTSPIVPLPLVLAGVVGLLVLLLILLIAA